MSRRLRRRRATKWMMTKDDDDIDPEEVPAEAAIPWSRLAFDLSCRGLEMHDLSRFLLDCHRR